MVECGHPAFRASAGPAVAAVYRFAEAIPFVLARISARRRVKEEPGPRFIAGAIWRAALWNHGVLAKLHAGREPFAVST